MKSEQVNLRLESDIVEALESAAREESLDRATMMRRLLIEALSQWRIKKALSDYQAGKSSIGKAAEDSGLDHWELIEVARRTGIAYPLDPQTAKRRLDELTDERSKQQKSRSPRRSKKDQTLPDIPPRSGRVLVVGINPASVSARVGHYYQGRLGRRLWKRFERVGLLSGPIPGVEDEAFARAGHGLTDLVKRPTDSASELTPAEIREGVDELRKKVRQWQPALIVFAFKKVADVVIGPQAAPGPGPEFEGAETFVLSGPYAPRTEAESIDLELKKLLRRIGL